MQWPKLYGKNRNKSIKRLPLTVLESKTCCKTKQNLPTTKRIYERHMIRALKEGFAPVGFKAAL